MKYGKKAVKKKLLGLNSRSTKWGKKVLITVLQVILAMILIIGIIGASGAIGVFKGVIASAPDISDIDVSPSNFSTFVYDNEGNQISKLVAAGSNRIMVSSEQIPQDLKDAFVAIEDERFFSHNGIDIKGLMRAVFTAIRTGFDDMQGASTITQQLIKNSVFPNFVHEDGLLDKLKRKIQEQYLAIELEKVMDKDTILVNYLNTINLGQNTLGVQAASLRYFNKDVSELTLSECAVIAAITQSPQNYNPLTNPEKNAGRREDVLENMKDQGMISQEEYDAAMADDVYSRIQNANIEIGSDNVNSYFIDALTDQLYQDLLDEGYSENQAYKLIYSGGLSIYSTMDSSIQAIVDEVFTDEANFPEKVKWQLSYALSIKKANGDLEHHSTEMYRAYFRKKDSDFNMLYSSQDAAYDAMQEYISAVLEEGDEVFAESISLVAQPQVSITIQDQHTGYVVALYGGRGEKTASKTLNRATDTVRQPGSTFKILSAYAPAIDCYGKTLASVYNDAPFWYTETLEPKLVQNVSKTYGGMTNFREAIARSTNVIAVKTLTEITPQLGFDYLEDFGFTTLVQYKEINGQGFTDIHQPTALGGLTDGVKNIELNAAYACIANLGVYIEPTLYTKVLDHDGNVIIDKTNPDSHTVLREITACLLTDAMTDVVEYGTGTRCKLDNMVVAGKTGTTSDSKDVWFAGFTPYYTATTWAGYDNNTKMTNSETPLARTLWKKVMSQIHEDLENKPFYLPEDIVTVTVCSKSGKLPVPGLCDATLTEEIFEPGTEPTESCNVHYAGLICAYDNLPASEGCSMCMNGVITLVPVENEALHAGSLPRDEEGNLIEGATIQTRTTCQHDAVFYSNPNYKEVLQQHWNELYLRQQAAAGQ